MKDIFTLIQHHKLVFTDFRKWLYLKLNKNDTNFKNVSKYPNSFKIPYLLEYLESKGVNIIEAITYYNFNHSYTTYEHCCIYMICAEFKRGEENKTIEYVPY